jgi:Ca-activated chloride channel homolog
MALEWQHPEWLYLILPLGAAWLALSIYSRRCRRRAAAAFVAQAMWSRILPADSPARFWTKIFLREAALVTGLFALAGPRFGTQDEIVVPRGGDLYVLMDVSRSMLAEDVPPSRLGRAKADVAALVKRLDGERVGLIAFAGQAVVKCPLTVDYDAFRRSLDELDPSSAPRGGTAIGDAIRKALEVFQARADRDQAILLITDGDDQQSYPLEAAAVAAERHVTIFTVGLGDADHGARIPQVADAKAYLEYQGQQVWSKLDGSLLKEIALKTSGVFVPVGTRAYDLAELYTNYLHGRRGTDEQSQKRIRRAEQFQVFLALALFALLADLFTRPYPTTAKGEVRGLEPRAVKRARAIGSPVQVAAPIATAILFLASLAASNPADNPAEAISEGLRAYGKGDFDKARDRFATAREQFDSADAGKAAIAAFDQACAAHKKGDTAQAREWYLKAGLARDKGLAASAHFNLGTLAAQEAARLAGEHPEAVPPDKRQEILDQVKAAVASFRHCVELQPDNSHARRDIELVRQWIKYYSDQWLAHDREKRRQETNLVAFLEFLIETQRALRESVKAFTATTPADAFAEAKRLQNELEQEVPTLKEKIETELAPRPGASGSAPQANTRELEQGITMLRDWASGAGDKMASAARQLDDRLTEPAAADQQAAIELMDKIWDAVIPFHPLLTRDLADQTAIAQSLAPASDGDAKSAAAESPAKDDPQQSKTQSTPSAKSPTDAHLALATEKENLAPIMEIQERTLRRTQLLKLKAQAELARPEPPQSPDGAQRGPGSSGAKDDPSGSGSAESKPVDPKQLKAGYQKAIELAPKAAEKMERVVKSLKQKDRLSAAPPAEEARKILEEIQKAQPKNEKQDQEQDKDKKNEDQKKQDQKDQQKKDEQQQDQRKDDQKKKDEVKKDQQQKKDQDKKKQDGADKADEKKDAKQPQGQVSRDRIEEALRRVRERQEEKRERDRQLKARVIGRVPVEKDW